MWVIVFWLAVSVTVDDCMTDTECEEAAKKLCDEGFIEWCE